MSDTPTQPREAIGPAPSPNDWVTMRHPELGDDQKPARVTRRAFEQTWKDKKWVLVEDKVASATTGDDAAAVPDAPETSTTSTDAPTLPGRSSRGGDT